MIADGVKDAPAGAAALIEGEALEAARRSDPREVAGVMRMFRHALDPDGADEAALARYNRRGLSAASTLDGMVAGSFLADEVSGSLILTAVNAACPLVSGDRRTAAQRRLDGFADICRRYLASPDAPMSGGGHAHVIVTMDERTATGTARTGPGATGGPTEATGAAATQRAAGPEGRRDWRHPVARTGAAQGRGEGWTECGPGSPGGTLSWVGRIAGSTARRVGLRRGRDRGAGR